MREKLKLNKERLFFPDFILGEGKEIDNQFRKKNKDALLFSFDSKQNLPGHKRTVKRFKKKKIGNTEKFAIIHVQRI